MNEKTASKFFNYKAWILDLDGTLYHQRPVQIYMAIWLAGYYCVHPFKIRELLMLREYRRLRENLFGAGMEDFSQAQIQAAAQKYCMREDAAMVTIKTWMIDRPLGIVRKCRRKKLLSIAKMYQESGGQVVVYSDNPVGEKLRAVDFSPTYAFWSDDQLIGCMKPEASGLRNILNFLRLSPKEVLYIGDRDDRDGICAASVGVDYIDVRAFLAQCNQKKEG